MPCYDPFCSNIAHLNLAEARDMRGTQQGPQSETLMQYLESVFRSSTRVAHS